jgi:nucleotide-binding universal stress UspA family protein
VASTQAVRAPCKRRGFHEKESLKFLRLLCGTSAANLGFVNLEGTRTMSLSQPPKSPETPNRIVLVAALDTSSNADQVIATVSALGQSLPGAELHLLHVVEAVPRDTEVGAPAFPTTTEMLEKSRSLLDKHIQIAAQRFAGKIVGHLAAGTPWREIVQFAAYVHADLVVVGTHDRKGLKRLVLGSVAEQVMRSAQCAVLVSRARDYTSTDVPEIEPPCAQCLETQKATNGEKLWCAQHTTHHPHGRLHYETPPTFGMGSMLIRT